MTLPSAMSRALTIAAVALATSTGVLAQQQQQQQQQQQPATAGGGLVAESFDCNKALRPDETTICSSPVLAAMDIQMATLYGVLQRLVKPETAVQMAAKQQAFLKDRTACATNATCIGNRYVQRIVELDALLRDIARRGPY